jgi:molecular chaperone GrpE
MADDQTPSDPLDGAAQAEAEGTGALAALQAELDQAKAKSTEYLDGWQRARAEFANYKRRVEKEQSEANQNATARVIGRFLDAIDDFDRAMADRPGEDAGPEAVNRWATGVSLIQRKLQNLLETENVERIQAEGQPFDPNLHEAVTHEDSDSHEAGAIIGVVRQGYRIGERVIRPALVRVAK